MFRLYILHFIGSISNQVHNNYSEPRVTVACYTCDTPVKHAIFCNFYSTVNDRSMCDALNALDGEFKTVIKIKDNFEKVSNETLPSICIIDGTSLRASTKNGEDFVTSLQFQVKNVWSTKFGILLEKDVVPPFHVLPSRYSTLIKTHLNISHSKIHHRSNMFSSMKMNNTTGMDLFEGPSIDESDIELPTCFSLSHPLDEMAPMLIKLPHANTQYYKDGSYKIVFVSETPSICLIYSTRTKLHSLYLLRKATSEECNSVCGNFNKTTEILSPSGNLNLASSISLYQTGNSKFMKLNSHKSWSDSSIRSPYASRPPSSMGSANRSKLESPMAGMFNRLGLSPHTSLGQASNSSMLMINPQTQPPAQPLFPDLCFDHIWTESHGNTNDGNGSIAMAQKAFLHVDHTGQNFLCYLVSNYLMQQLHVVKLEQPYSTNSSKKHLIVGVFSTIPAKDAVVLPTLNMMAIIDLSGNIVLHSGLTAIGKLHIGGILTALITSPYNQPQVFDKSFPRRSSLLPSSHARDITLFDDSVLHQLSPVPNRYGINVADNTINSPGLFLIFIIIT